MDERVSRSKLRGRPPEEIFNLDNCMRLCRDHHRMKTEGRLSLEGTTAQGSITFVLKLVLMTEGERNDNERA